MIPSQPNGKLTSTERRVFDLFARLEWHAGSSCVASLNLSEHEYKKWGEADFVLVGRHGPIVIEVKGGAVRCHEGIWTYESTRFGPVRRKESPYAQANGAFHSIVDSIADKFGDELSRGLGGFCVIFASMTRRQMQSIVGGPECPDVLTGYAEDIASEATLAQFISRVERHWIAKNAGGSGRTWTPDDCGRVTQFLRPNFDRVPPLSLRVAELRDERIQLTEEQYYYLDRLDFSDRLLVTGSAGCGKTFLAVESARREASTGRRVLFVSGTRHLATYLREGSDLRAAAEVLAYDELPSGTPAVPYDVLIVDEGQQLTTRASLDRLEAFLERGFEGGRWRWFTDPNRQVAADSAFDNETMELLRMLGNHEVPLVHNCRNTAQVVRWAEHVSGVDIGRPDVRGRGPEVALLKVNVPKHLPEEGAACIEKLIHADVQARDIVMLTGSEDGSTAAKASCERAGLVPKPWRTLFSAGADASPREVPISGIQDFRGLECEHVIIMGLDAVTDQEELRRLLYLSVTRATFSVSLIVLPEAHQRIVTLMQEGIKRYSR